MQTEPGDTMTQALENRCTFGVDLWFRRLAQGPLYFT